MQMILSPLSFSLLFLPESYIQLAIISISLLLSIVLGRLLIKNLVKVQIKSERLKKWIHSLPLPTFLLTLFLAISFAVFKGAFTGDPSLIRSALIVVLTSGVIKSTKPLFKNQFFVTIFAIGLWIVTLLSLTGLFQSTLTELDRLGFQVGKFRVSFLILIKSFLVLTLCSKAALFFSRGMDLYLQKINHIQPSSRILFSKLTRILLLVFSFLIGFSLVGIDLSVFTFFVGAIGIAIGLAVQNICSNLFSGIILLMDKSIKPGDVISLEGDNVYGVVHKLNARFVSIRTLEGREHLIPNEFFISNKTINWSHSDTLSRISIDFKVSYNTDLDHVEKILLAIANKTKRVLKDPPPAVYFSSIIENAVELQLTVWLNDPQNGKSGIISSIIFNAWKRFKEENIEIPYTPSELHIIYPNSKTENILLRERLDQMQPKAPSQNN